MTNPKISVTIPVYNQKPEWLEACIYSILANDYKNIEIIIVDDGSGDVTEYLPKELLDVYKKFSGDPIFKSFQNNHYGIWKARNFAIRQATGKYIMPVDSDDTISPTCISDLVKAVNENPDYDIYYRDYFHYTETTGKAYKIPITDFTGKKKWNLPALMFKNKGTEGFPNAGSFFLKSAYEKLGFYNIAWETRQDTHWIIKNLGNLRLYQAKDTGGYFVRRHENNVSSNMKFRARNIARMLLWLAENCKRDVLYPEAKTEQDYWNYVSSIFSSAPTYIPCYGGGEENQKIFEREFQTFVNKHYRWKNVNFTFGAPLKIAMLSLWDYSAAGYHIQQAVTRMSKHKVDLITKEETDQKHKRGNLQIGKDEAEDIKQVINDADIIHFKGDAPPFVAIEGFERTLGTTLNITKPIIITIEGSQFRQKSDNEFIALARWEPERYKKEADLITTVTPDLNYPELEGEFIPHAYDTKSFKNAWKWNPEEFIISHTPSERRKKGTETIFIPAIYNLQQKYKNLKAIICDDLTNEQAIEVIQNSQIFFDQCAIGWYGYSGIEAGACGIPVFSWISDEALNQLEDVDLGDFPVIGFKKSAKGLEIILEIWLNLKEAELRKISIKTKEWFDNFHSYETIGKIWANKYEELK